MNYLFNNIESKPACHVVNLNYAGYESGHLDVIEQRFVGIK